MSEWPWKGAGQRLDERESRRRFLRDRASAERRKLDVAAARDAWAKGQLRPFVLTMAMDLRGLEGPGVDIACGGEEPMVDRWEAGDLYPTWEQLLALADLTQLPIGYFTRPHRPPEGMFICARGLRARSGWHEPEPAVVKFSEAALTAHFAALGPVPR